MPSTRPSVVTGSDPTGLEIEWDDGHVTRYTARELRLLCPCAQCVHEWTGERMLEGDKVARDLTQNELKMVGNYALTMRFSDGHHLGIYTLPMLRENDPGRELPGE